MSPPTPWGTRSASLTGGERNDITQIEPLLEGLKAGHVVADKGYDGQRAMDAITTAGAMPVVPRRTATATWRRLDRELYKQRNRSNACSVTSNTSGGWQPDTTSSPETVPASSTSSPSSSGCDECQDDLGPDPSPPCPPPAFRAGPPQLLRPAFCDALGPGIG